MVKSLALLIVSKYHSCQEKNLKSTQINVELAPKRRATINRPIRFPESKEAVVILPSTTFYSWKVFCGQTFVIGQF